LNEGLKNLENEVKNALEQSEDEQSFMDAVDTKSASIDFLLDMLFTWKLSKRKLGKAYLPMLSHE